MNDFQWRLQRLRSALDLLDQSVKWGAYYLNPE